MTLRPNDVPRIYALRSAARALWRKPRLLGLAYGFHTKGHADSVWSALMILKSRRNREFYSDPMAQAMGEIAKDEGRCSPFTMAPEIRQCDALRRARERRELQRRLAVALAAGRVARAHVTQLVRELSRASAARWRRQGRTARHVGVTRAHRSRRAVARCNSPPGADEPHPGPEPPNIWLVRAIA